MSLRTFGFCSRVNKNWQPSDKMHYNCDWYSFIGLCVNRNWRVEGKKKETWIIYGILNASSYIIYSTERCRAFRHCNHNGNRHSKWTECSEYFNIGIRDAKPPAYATFFMTNICWLKEAGQKKYLYHNDFLTTSFSQRLTHNVSLTTSFS